MNAISIRNGLHSGILIMVLGSILHAISSRYFLNWYGFVGYVVFLIFMVRSVLQVRENEGGILSFGPAFVAAFIPHDYWCLHIFDIYIRFAQLDKP